MDWSVAAAAVSKWVWEDLAILRAAPRPSLPQASAFLRPPPALCQTSADLQLSSHQPLPHPLRSFLLPTLRGKALKEATSTSLENHWTFMATCCSFLGLVPEKNSP